MKSDKGSQEKKKSLLNLIHKYKYKNSKLNILKNLAVYQDYDKTGFISEIQLSKKNQSKYCKRKLYNHYTNRTKNT